MKIYLIGNYKFSYSKSMYLYVNIIKKLIKKKNVKIKILYPNNILNFFDLKNKSIKKYLGYLDKYLFFGIKLFFLIKKNDVVHITDHADSLLLPFLRTKKIIITCHDLINIKKIKLKKKLSFTGKIYQILIINNLKKAKLIISVSNNTKKELINFCKINKDNIKVIYHAVNQNFLNKKNFKVLGNKKIKYFLHVGDNKEYKNRDGVIKIFKELLNFKKFNKYKLILAGKKISDQIYNKIKIYNLDEKIINIIDPNSNKLSNLYKNSEGLIFPSLEEGFGWPIIEAQKLGCIVYTTNKPPMNEIGERACIYIKSKSPKISAQIIKQTYHKRKKIKYLAKINVKRFNNKKFIYQYLEAYKEINEV